VCIPLFVLRYSVCFSKSSKAVLTDKKTLQYLTDKQSLQHRKALKALYARINTAANKFFVAAEAAPEVEDTAAGTSLVAAPPPLSRPPVIPGIWHKPDEDVDERV
jgi:hypothetical protein